MIYATDQTKELIKLATVQSDLEEIVVKTTPPIMLHLDDWEKAGLRISVSVDKLGCGYFNEQPYADKETALSEYNRVLDQVQKGNYVLELYGRGKIKLVLTDAAE